MFWSVLLVKQVLISIKGSAGGLLNRAKYIGIGPPRQLPK